MQEKARRRMNYSTRPSSFGSLYQVKRPHDNSSYIITNINNINNEKKLNTVKAQKQKPVKKLKHGAKQAFTPKIVEEIKFINDLMVKENTNPELFISDSVLNLKFFCFNFIDKCFNGFVKHFERLFQTHLENENIHNSLEKYDFYNFANVCAFFMEFFRIESYRNQEKQKQKFKKKDLNIPFIFTPINSVFSEFITERCYENVFNHSDEKNAEKRIFEMYSSLRLIKMYMLISLDAYKGNTDNNLELNVFLQDKLITKNYVKIFKNMIILFKEEYYPISLLAELIELMEIYYSSVELYASKRKLMVKEKKRKKKAAKKKDDEEAYLEKVLKQVDDENNDQDESVSSIEDAPVYKERALDIKEEFTSTLDYNVILKFFLIINKEGKLVKESDGHYFAIKYINKIFMRIFKLEYQWIFYNIEILNEIQQVLSKLPDTNSKMFSNKDSVNIMSLITEINSKFDDKKSTTIARPIIKNNFDINDNQDSSSKVVSNSSSLLNDFKEICLKISNSFFTTLKTNKLLAIECLFRFTNSITKDHILNNYEEFEEKVDLEVADDINGDFEDEQEYYDGLLEFNKAEDDEEEERGKKNKKNKNKNEKKAKKIRDNHSNSNYNYNDEDDEVKDNEAKDKDKDKDETRLSPFWNKAEDILLVDTYKEHNEEDDFDNTLISTFPTKELGMIKERIKVLKIKRNINKAYLRIERIYDNNSKVKTSKEKQKAYKAAKENLFNIILDLNEECRDEQFKDSLFRFIDNLIEQLRKYSIKVTLLEGSNDSDFVFTSSSVEELNLTNSSLVEPFLLNIGFVKVFSRNETNNNVDKGMIDENDYNDIFSWALKTEFCLNSTELNILIEKLEKFRQTLVSNLNLVNERREKEKMKVVKALVPQIQASKKKKKLKKAKGNYESDDLFNIEELNEFEFDDKASLKEEVNGNKNEIEIKEDALKKDNLNNNNNNDNDISKDYVIKPKRNNEKPVYEDDDEYSNSKSIKVKKNKRILKREEVDDDIDNFSDIKEILNNNNSNSNQKMSNNVEVKKPKKRLIKKNDDKNDDEFDFSNN